MSLSSGVSSTGIAISVTGVLWVGGESNLDGGVGGVCGVVGFGEEFVEGAVEDVGCLGAVGEDYDLVGCGGGGFGAVLGEEVDEEDGGRAYLKAFRPVDRTLRAVSDSKQGSRIGRLSRKSAKALAYD